MRRSYKETIDALQEELIELEESRSELKAKLAKADTRVAQLIESIRTLSRLEPPLRQIERLIGGDPPSRSGLSDAVRLVFRADPGLLFPTEVRDRLKASGYDIDQHSNVLASIHTCLKRMVEAGELETKEVEGKTAYRLKPEPILERMPMPKRF
jgi:hypothetical protein